MYDSIPFSKLSRFMRREAKIMSAEFLLRVYILYTIQHVTRMREIKIQRPLPIRFISFFFHSLFYFIFCYPSCFTEALTWRAGWQFHLIIPFNYQQKLVNWVTWTRKVRCKNVKALTYNFRVLRRKKNVSTYIHVHDIRKHPIARRS